MDVRGATGVQIGDNTQMHLHLRSGPVPWWTRSGYVEQVRDIAPGRLVDRDGELAELAAFCAGDAGYLWFRAGPWAGKSALLSTFVLNPPADVDVVAFFVTARLAAQSDSTAFTDALLDQLSAIVGESVPASLTPATRDAHRRALLRAAADRLLAEGRRLVLVVDGLDEDRGCRPGSGLPSVASLLPKVCGDGLRVIVAGRPGVRLPDDVPDGHPLREGCQVRELAVSRHASRVAQLAGRELRELLHGDPCHVDIVGLIAAAGGGLTVDDLEELTGLPPYRLEGLLGGPFGRTVVGRGGPPAVYLFAHEVLRETAIHGLGSALGGVRDRLHVWAGTYRQRGWPADTPQYLLRGYGRMLTENGDLDRLADLAVDPRRHDRMLGETGGDAAALSDIRAAVELAGAAPPTEENLCRLARLAHHREQLEKRNDSVPTGLPAVWARLGEPTRAEALAHSIPDPQRRARALAALARPVTSPAAAENGDLDHALRVARGIAGAARRERALAALVSPLARAGRAGLAEKIARGMTTPGGRANQLAGLAWTLAAIGETDQARRVALDAERTARDTATRHRPSWVRAGLVRVLAVAGEADRAERMAQGIKHPDWRPKALAVAAAALAVAGEFERAERLGHAVVDAEQRVRALAELVRATTKAGDDVRARRLSGDAERIARGIGSARGRAAALTELLGATGDAEQGRRIAADVELIAGHIDSDGKRAAVLAGLAGALAAAGEIEQARRVAAAVTSAPPPVLASLTPILPERAAGIGDPYWQARGLAAAASATGRPDHAGGLAREAERVAGRVANPAHRAVVLVELVRVLAAAGDAGQARRLAGDAERIARDIPGQDQRARVLAELARVAGGPDTYRLLACAFAVGSWLTPLAAVAETCPRLAVRIIDAVYDESSNSPGGVSDQVASGTAEGSSEK